MGPFFLGLHINLKSTIIRGELEINVPLWGKSSWLSEAFHSTDRRIGTNRPVVAPAVLGAG